MRRPGPEMRPAGRAAAIAFAIMLTGCAGAAGAGRDATPVQRLYAADGGYRALLSLAVAYKQACDARPPALRTRCAGAVESLRDLDRRYAAARGRAEAGDAPDLAALETVLSAFNARLAATLAESGDE